MITFFFVDISQFFPYCTGLFFKTDCSWMDPFEGKGEDLFLSISIGDGVDPGNKINKDGTRDDEGY
jgi:hypothetical protein